MSDCGRRCRMWCNDSRAAGRRAMVRRFHVLKSACCAGAALLALTLCACSSGHGPALAAPAAPASAWLAVARGQVGVAGGMVLVAARTDGTVDSVAVRQGARVTAGQVLARLDPRAAQIEVATAEAGVAQARAQLDALQVALHQAGQRAPRIAIAARAGAASGDAAEQARDEVASLKARHAAARAALEIARQRLASARLVLAATELRAPVAGVVVTRHVSIGQAVSVASGQPLFEVLPDRPRVVRAQVNADAAGAIHPGMEAEVVRDSGSGPVYHAKVLWVGQVLQPASLTDDPLARAVANDVDCTLELGPDAAGVAPLRIGQRVLVRFPRATH